MSRSHAVLYAVYAMFLTVLVVKALFAHSGAIFPVFESLNGAYVLRDYNGHAHTDTLVAAAIHEYCCGGLKMSTQNYHDL